MEPVRRVGKQDDFAFLARRLQRRAHLLHGVVRNATVGRAVQAEHRRVDKCCHVHRVFRFERAGRAGQRAVPGNASLDCRIVRGIEPDDAPAPAKAGHREFVGVGLARRFGKRDAGIKIGHDLRIGYFADHFGDDFRDLGDLRHVALPRVQLA